MNTVALIACASEVTTTNHQVVRRIIFLLDRHSKSSLVLFGNVAQNFTFEKWNSIKLSNVLIYEFKGEKNLKMDNLSKLEIEQGDVQSKQLQKWRAKQGLKSGRFL